MELNFKPRGWQKEALPLWLKNMNGVVSVVTGGGKTVFAFMTIIEFMKNNNNGQVVIIVPSIALQDQWYVGIMKDLSLSSRDIKCYSGSNKPKKPGLINIIIINTARTIDKKSFKKNTFLIVDECHRSGSQENSKCFEIPHTATLGLSATPVREFDDGFAKYIQPNLGEIIFEYAYEEAYQDGVISDFKLVNVRTFFNEEEQEQYNAFGKRIAILLTQIKKGVGSEEKLKFLMLQRSRLSSSAENRIPVALNIILKNKDKKVLVFTESIAHANLLYEYLEDKLCSVTIYHSKVADAFKHQNLLCYRNNDYRILITCRALDEGMNVPETEVAVIVSATSSIRQRIQRLGRVLRVSTGKDLAMIYTIYITDQERKRLNNEADKFKNMTSVDWVQMQLDE